MLPIHRSHLVLNYLHLLLANEAMMLTKQYALNIINSNLITAIDNNKKITRHYNVA
jgi:hypothetical protein